MNYRENTPPHHPVDAPERVLTGACDLSTGIPRRAPRGLRRGAAGMTGLVDARWRDVWGVGWRKLQDGVMGNPEHNPLQGRRTWPLSLAQPRR